MKKVPTATPVAAGDSLVPRTVVVGLEIAGEARAYPFPMLRQQSPVLDTLAGVPLAIVVGEDSKSIRAFDRRVDGRTLELLAVAGARPLKLVDAQTSSEWDFSGRAVSGPLAGRQLAKVRALKEYWFDWRSYSPATSVFERRLRAAGAPGAATH